MKHSPARLASTSLVLSALLLLAGCGSVPPPPKPLRIHNAAAYDVKTPPAEELADPERYFGFAAPLQPDDRMGGWVFEEQYGTRDLVYYPFPIYWRAKSRDPRTYYRSRLLPAIPASFFVNPSHPVADVPIAPPSAAPRSRLAIAYDPNRFVGLTGKQLAAVRHDPAAYRVSPDRRGIGFWLTLPNGRREHEDGYPPGQTRCPKLSLQCMKSSWLEKWGD